MPGVLAVDVGGNHVKVLLEGETTSRRIDSGPELTAAQMIEGVLALTDGWTWDRVSIGVPAPVHKGRVTVDPFNLGAGWAGFDYAAGFGVPTKVVNDAAMQALGSYEGDVMLFLGLGTGLGSALAAGGVVLPLELAHLPYRKSTFEEHVGQIAYERDGKKQWRKHVADVVETLTAAFVPDYVVLGGGNARKLDEIPPNARLGANDNAFVGAFRLWDADAPARMATG
jgi:polyphosphate glucokinase